MTFTVQELLIDAMSLIGAVAVDEVPNASELNLGLRVANMMIDRWSSMPNMLRAAATVSFTATSTKAEYTVGLVGCDVTAKKPIKVFSAYVRDSSNVDYALEIVPKSFYNTLQDKNLASGRPLMLAYDAIADQQAAPYGTISLYYTPDTNYTIYVDCSQDLTEFAALSDSILFDPTYYEALKYSIAVRLFRHYHTATVQIPPDLIMSEQMAIKTLYSMNHQPVYCALDLPVSGGTYNVYTDSY